MLAFYFGVYMKKIKKLTKKKLVSNSTTFVFDHASKKVSLLYFLEWAQKAIPKGAEDITLELEEEWEDDYYLNTSIVISWKEWIKK